MKKFLIITTWLLFAPPFLAGQTYTGQMSLLIEDKVFGKSHVYAQKVNNIVFELQVSEGAINNLSIGEAAALPAETKFENIHTFEAVWNKHGQYSGKFHSRPSSDLYKYLTAVDYIFREYKESSLNTIRKGIGLFGWQPARPDFFQNLNTSSIYEGSASFIMNSPDGKMTLLNGWVMTIVDPIRKNTRVLINIQYDKNYGDHMGWIIPFPSQGNIQQKDELWMGFYGPEEEELGGVFSVVKETTLIQGIFFAKKRDQK